MLDDAPAFVVTPNQLPVTKKSEEEVYTATGNHEPGDTKVSPPQVPILCYTYVGRGLPNSPAAEALIHRSFLGRTAVPWLCHRGLRGNRDGWKLGGSGGGDGSSPGAIWPGDGEGVSGREQQGAKSYVEVPQTLKGREIYLGCYALDVEKVPILLSIKTLRKLGAVIDFHRQTIIFKLVDPGIMIPLTKSRSGHLLLDLTRDWFQQPRATSDLSPEPSVLSQMVTSSRYKERSFESEFGLGESQLPLPECPVVKSQGQLRETEVLTCHGDADCLHMSTGVAVYDMSVSDEPLFNPMGTSASKGSTSGSPVEDGRVQGICLHDAKHHTGIHGDEGQRKGQDPEDPCRMGCGLCCGSRSS